LSEIQKYEQSNIFVLFLFTVTPTADTNGFGTETDIKVRQITPAQLAFGRTIK